MNITYFDFNYIVKVNATAEYYESLRARLHMHKIVDKNLVRVGRANDGGYIMVDDFKSNIAYSFGIAGDVSWDLDMANRGCEVFMYDPTIDGLPQENARFHFFKEGIAGFEFPDKNLNTLENFIKRNGHDDKDNMILKMDVEGAEWSFLATISSETLSRFDQMVFEFHDLIMPKDYRTMNATLACINKINLTHSLVHLHANNYDSLLILDDKILMPNILEMTYVKTSNYELVDDENIFLPNSLDQPNHPYRKDIPLGFWNKKFNNVVTRHE